MSVIRFPVIDPVATGANICRLRKDRGLTVRDLQQYFGFEEPQAIYKWQRGQSLPSVDNLYALSALLQVPMNEIIISTSHIVPFEQQASARCSLNFVRRRYTVLPLLRKSHPVINEEFCILPCTLRTRLQYMCFSDC